MTSKASRVCAQPDRQASNTGGKADAVPMVMQLMAKVTGKVKLTAARACVPSNDKKVSTRLNIKIATIPNMVGMVMVRGCALNWGGRVFAIQAKRPIESKSVDKQMWSGRE